MPTPPCSLARDLYARRTRTCFKTQHQLQPAALAFVSYWFVLVRVRVPLHNCLPACGSCQRNPFGKRNISSHSCSRSKSESREPSPNWGARRHNRHQALEARALVLLLQCCSKVLNELPAQIRVEMNEYLTILAVLSADCAVL